MIKTSDLKKFRTLKEQQYGKDFYLTEKHLPNGDIQIIVLTQKIQKELATFLDHRQHGRIIASLEETEGIPLSVIQEPVNLYTKRDQNLNHLADQLTAGEHIRVLNPQENAWVPVTVHHDFEDQAPKEVGWIIYRNADIGNLSQTSHGNQNQDFYSVIKGFLKEKATYKLGGKSHEIGFDCSGFTQMVIYKSTGLRLPRLVRWQALVGRAVSLESIQPKDLVFFHEEKGHINHVGIVVEPQKDKLPVIAHSSVYANGIIIENLEKASGLGNLVNISGFRRII